MQINRVVRAWLARQCQKEEDEREQEAYLGVRHGVHVGLVEVTIGVHLLDLLGVLGTDGLRLVSAL